MRSILPILIAASLYAAPNSHSAQPQTGGVQFSRDVRPILSQHCFKCHGPDEKTRKGKLRLDIREEALKAGKSGEVAIVPGKPDASEVIKRIYSHDEEELMPPPAAKKEISESQKKILKDWIAAGAEYVPHWAFVKPAQAPTPAGGPANPIDAFVGAALRVAGLQPSTQADRHTLARRVSLDLIGRTPTPAETAAFVEDQSPDAYAKFVDQLLASPQYGERWARKWLDLARYADTNGYEKDRPRTIWPYRDWVINALNADMPFDQFTIEQIAGDMLPNATPSQIIATGFHRNTMLNEEGGIDPLEFRFNAVTDRLGTTGKTWLGLTIQCAQCHTHKYDPITHREYYQMMAFLNNSDEPNFDLLPADNQARRAGLEAKIAKLTADLPNRYKVTEPATSEWKAPVGASVQTLSGETAKVQPDGSWLFSGQGADTDTYTVTIDTELTGLNAIKIEVPPDPSLPKNGPGRSESGNFVLSEISVSARSQGSEEALPIKLSSAAADYSQPDYDIAKAIDGDPTTGWAVGEPTKKPGKQPSKPHHATFSFEKPLTIPGRTQLTIQLTQNHGTHHTLGQFRLLLGTAPAKEAAPLEQRRQATIEKNFAAWLAKESEAAARWTVLKPTSATSNLPLLTILDDASVLASGDQTKADTYTLKLPASLAGITAIRVEALPDDSLPAHGPGRTYYEGPPGEFNLSNIKLSAGDTPLKFNAASQSYGAGKNGAAYAIDDNLQTGWEINGGQGRRHVAVFNLSAPIKDSQELTLTLQCEKYYSSNLGRFRIAVTNDPRQVIAHGRPPAIEEILLLPAAKRSAEQVAQLRQEFFLSAFQLADAQKEIYDLQTQLFTFPTTLVMRERPPQNPRPTFIHNRGEYLQPTDKVSPGVLAVLNPLQKTDNPTRLDFARWLVSQENPLTARVTVNRQWAAFFGQGIVRTVDDFGFQGEPPSNQALLDWLSVEFMKQGWSLKKLHRLIVTSATYQQSSRVTPELLAKDPANRLLARGPRFRLEAEMIRDSVLNAASLLSPKIGGPSVRPPQPAGVQDAAYGHSDWPTSTGEDRFRRGLYTFAKRSAPYAMSASFDAPSGEVCVAQREVSNTPLQALAMLNDTVIIEAAQALGNIMAKQPGSVTERIDALVLRCLGRPPTAPERAQLETFLNDQIQRCTDGKLDAKTLAGPGDGDPIQRAAWTALARTLFNLDEALIKG